MEPLYHYCSTETFHSIVKNKSIWLSSLTQSNDSKEGAVILEILIELANEADLTLAAQGRLERALRAGFDFLDGLGFCLSEEGDLLSQWRGYANDGTGVAIGFNREYLAALGTKLRESEGRSFGLKKLVYDRDGQREIAAEHFNKIKRLLDEGAFSPEEGSLLSPNDKERKVKIKNATQNANFAILATMLSMFEIKNPAFAEEKEWRLVSFGLKNSEETEVKYRPCGNKIVPYYEIDILELGIAPIQNIFLGPKHQTPDHVVKNMLASAQLGSPNISRSTATYR